MQELWREIGQDDLEHDSVLLQLEDDLLSVYMKNAKQIRTEKANQL
jgi:hypothetical protein